MKLLPKNILAIDDSLTLRKFIEKALVSEDCVKHLLLASDWSSGLELAIQHKPDLILCDYTLPEIKGDELCRRLASTPETARIPVILMSSSAPEMSRLNLDGTNILRLLVKPFSKELLVATVSYVLNQWEQKAITRGTSAATGLVLMRGNTDASALCQTFRYIETEKLTGALRLGIQTKTLHVFCKDGVVRVISTRDVDEYLKDTPFLSHGRKSPFWLKSEERQRQTLSPFLLNLSLDGILPIQTAQTLTQLYGHRLMAQIWTERGLSYEFEQFSPPDFVELCFPREKKINDWILASLRTIQTSDEIESYIADPRGVPFFTPEGYRQLQEISPQKEERQILSLINGSMRLNEICLRLRFTPEFVARKVFCFQRLGFLDFWPSTTLVNPN